MGAEGSTSPAQRGGDRSGMMRTQQQQVPGRTTRSRSRSRQARPGRDGVACGPQEEQMRGCGGSDSDSGGVSTEEIAGEEVLLGGRGLAGGVAGAEDDEEVGWWARSADKLLALGDGHTTTGDAIARKERGEAPGGSGKHGRTAAAAAASSSRCSRTAVACKAPTGAAGDGLSRDRVGSFDPHGKVKGAPPVVELPPEPARKPGGTRAGHPRPVRGEAHRDGDAEGGGTVGVREGAPAAAAVPGGGRLRVSWSSISTRSSENDLERESAPASSVASTSNCSSSGSSKTGGSRACRWQRGDAPGAASPRPRPQQQRRHQEQQQQQQQTQLGSSYNRVSPSSCSSSSVSSHAPGRQNRGRASRASTGSGRVCGGVSVRVGVAAVGRRHQREGGAEEAASGSTRRIPKARPAAVPGSRRKLAHRAPIAGGGITTDSMDDTGKPAVRIKPGRNPAAAPIAMPTAPSYRLLSDGGRSSRHRAAAGVDAFRESDGGDGGGGAVGVPPSASSALRQGGFLNGWSTAAVAPVTSRAAAGVALHHSSGKECKEWGWRGSSETGRDRGLQAMPPENGVNEVLRKEERGARLVFGV